MTAVQTLSWAELAALLRAPAPAASLAAPTGATGHTGPAQVIGVDGRSGAGKSWLAERLAAALGCDVLHSDAFVPGWSGLDRGVHRLAHDLLRPWSQGAPGRIQQYDWNQDRPGRTVELAPAPRVVLEGCGVGAVEDRSLLTVLLWVDTPARLRAERLDARSDRDDYLPFRALWAAQEESLEHRARTPQRADLVVSGCTERDVRLTVAPRSHLHAPARTIPAPAPTPSRPTPSHALR